MKIFLILLNILKKLLNKYISYLERDIFIILIDNIKKKKKKKKKN